MQHHRPHHRQARGQVIGCMHVRVPLPKEITSWAGVVSGSWTPTHAYGRCLTNSYCVYFFSEEWGSKHTSRTSPDCSLNLRRTYLVFFVVYFNKRLLFSTTTVLLSGAVPFVTSLGCYSIITENLSNWKQYCFSETSLALSQNMSTSLQP